MNRALLALLAASLTAGFAPLALAAKSCDELKAEIEAKIKAKGVTKFTLDAVPNAEVKDQKVVGSCDGSKKKLVYKRG